MQYIFKMRINFYWLTKHHSHIPAWYVASRLRFCWHTLSKVLLLNLSTANNLNILLHSRDENQNIRDKVCNHFFFHGATSLSGEGLLIIDASRSHSDTPHSVGFIWTSDQPDAETSTWQHTTLTRDRYPCPQRDSHLQSQEESGYRPKPYTARPLGSAQRHFAHH
jgi:hypothetical protein